MAEEESSEIERFEGIEMESEEAAKAEGEAAAAAVAAAPDQINLSEASTKAETFSVAAGGRIRPLIELLKKSPQLLRAAAREARKGYEAFMKWVNSLSNFNPVKWAIKGSPSYVVWELIDWLLSNVPMTEEQSRSS